MRIKRQTLLFLASSLIFLLACKKEDCKECVKTICGIADCQEVETKTVCSEKEQKELEESEGGNVFWTCQ